MFFLILTFTKKAVRNIPIHKFLFKYLTILWIEFEKGKLWVKCLRLQIHFAKLLPIRHVVIEIHTVSGLGTC